MHKIAVVTGPTSGIGLSIARRLVADGWQLYAVARDADRLAATFLPLHHAVIADLADVAAAAGALDALDLREASHAVLVNNAGVIEPIGHFWRLEPAALAAALAVDVTTPLVLAGAFYRKLLEAPGCLGAIVQIGSGAANRPISGWSAYCTAKAALHHASATLAVEVDPARCRVMVLSPGILDTAMQATIRASDPGAMPDHGYFTSLHANGGLGSPDRPARWLSARLRAWDLPHGVVIDLHGIDDAMLDTAQAPRGSLHAQERS